MNLLQVALILNVGSTLVFALGECDLLHKLPGREPASISVPPIPSLNADFSATQMRAYGRAVQDYVNALPADVRVELLNAGLAQRRFNRADLLQTPRAVEDLIGNAMNRVKGLGEEKLEDDVPVDVNLMGQQLLFALIAVNAVNAHGDANVRLHLRGLVEKGSLTKAFGAVGLRYEDF